MKIFLAADHAGYELKNRLNEHLSSQGYEIVDKGAFEFDKEDDYPDFITQAAEAVAREEGSFGIIIGGSGEGEAMCANRVKGVRAAVYYGGLDTQIDITGNSIDIIASARIHNNANVLSLGARFLTEEEVRAAVKKFLETPFQNEERHLRRIKKLDQ